MRRRSALVALFAVALHALSPLLASAAPGAAVDHVQLCTAQGVVTVEVDAGGAPPASLAATDHCSVCAFQGGIAAPVRALPAAQAAAAGKISLRPQPVAAVPTRTASRPRAPPLDS